MTAAVLPRSLSPPRMRNRLTKLGHFATVSIVVAKRVNYAEEYAKKMASRAKWTVFYANKKRHKAGTGGAVVDPPWPGPGGAAK